MIIFNLKCIDCNYDFEGWFENSNEFLKQKRKKLISCPSCESLKIQKGLMTPNLNKKSNAKKQKIKKTVASNVAKLKEMVEKNFDYVGDKFTEEAKKMKYGEINERPIYGEATIDQTKDLVEENISVVPLPWSNSKKVN